MIAKLRRFSLCTLTCIAAPWVGCAAAQGLTYPDTADAETTLSFYVRPEYYQWEEFKSGSKLLSETGPRVRGGMHYEASSWVEENAVSGAIDLAIVAGAVNYNGALMDGTPLTTTTQYSGLSLGLTSSVRWYETARVNSDMTLGLLGDIWTRQLMGSAGYTEKYQILSGAAGLRVIFPEVSRLAIDFGMRYPLMTREDVDAFGITLSPAPAMGYYAKIDFARLLPFHDHAVGLALTMDMINFERSPSVKANDGKYYGQPESKMQLIGMQLSF